MSQLDALNKDFRLLNTDKLDPNHPFYGLAADAAIEFCLAKRDSNNVSTTGIIRYNKVQDGWTVADFDAIVKPATASVDSAEKLVVTILDKAAVPSPPI